MKSTLSKNVVAVLTFLVLLAGASGCGLKSKLQGPPEVETELPALGMRSFENCEEFKVFLREKTKNDFHADSVGESTPSAGQADDSGSPQGAAPAEAPTSTTSNTVEEADLVRQSGNRLYVLNSFYSKDGGFVSRLFIYDVSNAQAPQRIGKVSLTFTAREMYVHENRLAVIGEEGEGQQATHLEVFDVTHAELPVSLKSYTLSGSYSDSRKVGGSIYLALQSWINAYEASQPDTDLDESVCATIYAPVDLDEGGYSVVIGWNLVGLNLNDLLDQPKTMTVLGSYQSTLTATPEHLYLANYYYGQDATGIFQFDLNAETADIVLNAQANAPGVFVNQFSLDESDGYFRIATTTNQNTAGAADNRNYITLYQSSNLALTGQIDSIVPGESITAARFMGTKAFLTTFVTIDPLVTVDLSNPAQPKVMGELKVPGFANYLRLWGEDRLVSIGVSQGWSGVLLSLFDVSDFSSPKLVQQMTLSGAYTSEAQFQHKAFSLFEDSSLLAIPVQTSSGSTMKVFSLDANLGFTLVAELSHDDLIDSTVYAPSLRRSLEIGDALYTVSDTGLKAHSETDWSLSFFGEIFPDFTPGSQFVCGCNGDVCFECAMPD